MEENDMSDAKDNDYTIEELLEEAKNDPNWEPDANKRAVLTAQLKRILSSI